MTDWSKPSLTDQYASVLSELMGRDASAATMTYSADTNMPNGTIRWNPSTYQFEIYNTTGGNWSAWSAQLNIGTVLLGNNTVSGTMQAVPRSQADTLYQPKGAYANFSGSMTQTFQVAYSASGTQQSVPRSQGDTLYQSASFSTDTSTTANAIVLALEPAITAYTDGQLVRFKAANSNTGAATININAVAAVALVSPAGALQGGEIVNGAQYAAIYSAANNNFVLVESGAGSLPVNPATMSNQAVNLGQLNALFGAIADVTASRSAATIYTNSTGRPLFVSVALTMTTNVSATASLQVNGLGCSLTSPGVNGGTFKSVCAIVPPGATYELIYQNYASTILHWVEVN